MVELRMKNIYQQGLPKRDSEQEDQQSKEIFLRSVMERILEHNRREHETLMTLMLAQQRHFQSPLTPNSDLSSGFLTLNSHQQDKIFEENRKKFIPMPPPRFPRPDNEVIVGCPEFMYKDNIRITQFWSLRDKLKKQFWQIVRLTSLWTRDVRDNILIDIFDEVYRLQLEDLNSNERERLIIESVSRIIRDSNLSREQKRAFMLFFSSTINTPENIMYCRKMAEL